MAVKDLLSRSDGGTVGVGVEEVSHDSDDGVLLDIEWTGVERPRVTESGELPTGKKILQTPTEW